MILTSFDFRSTQGWPRAFWLIWPEMVLWLLQCLNWLHHVNLNVSMTPWKEVNIFEIFGVWHEIEGGQNMVSTVLITCTLVLWPFHRHCTYFLYIMMMYVFHLYLTCVVSFLSLYTCFLVYITCLYFKLNALMDLVWVFQLRQVASLSCHDLSSCKDFQEFFVDRPRM